MDLMTDETDGEPAEEGRAGKGIGFVQREKGDAAG